MFQRQKQMFSFKTVLVLELQNHFPKNEKKNQSINFRKCKIEITIQEFCYWESTFKCVCTVSKENIMLMSKIISVSVADGSKSVTIPMAWVPHIPSDNNQIWILLRYRSNWQIIQNRIISFIVLSSDNTNCKNDIQLFHQLFDELSVYRDYH